MRIESSNLALTSISSQMRTSTVTEQLNAWVDTNNFQEDADRLIENPQNQIDAFIQNSKPVSAVDSVQEEFTFQISEQDRMKIELLTKMMESLTGKRMKVFIPMKLDESTSKVDMHYNSLLAQAQAKLLAQSEAKRQGWGIDYKRVESVEETSQMSFSAQGIVKTADGKSLNIKLNLNVSRSFVSQSQFSFKAGDALIDPLVVNFNRDSAELTNRDFRFDIDSDGSQDTIAFVQSGSGFLVYDKNQDGKVNDGSELFGPLTGNGFAELKAMDRDGNNWIDENDPIYNRLQIWTKDEMGRDYLLAIGQAGIGAIYLSSIASPYELKDSSNAVQGKIAQTGVFLRQDGSVGTVQHVDLSI